MSLANLGDAESLPRWLRFYSEHGRFVGPLFTDSARQSAVRWSPVYAI